VGGIVGVGDESGGVGVTTGVVVAVGVAVAATVAVGVGVGSIVGWGVTLGVGVAVAIGVIVGVGVEQPPAVVISRAHPPEMIPTSPPRSSTTYKLQVPFGSAPLKAARVSVPHEDPIPPGLR
jgi:hypothetical protein